MQRSRAVILDLADNKNVFHDQNIALTTAHGLVDKYGNVLETCAVIGPSGKAYPIKAVQLAPNYQPGTTSDWAVISFEKLQKEMIERYVVMRR